MSFYEGNKVFLTGGSAGIGHECAIQLAAAGASVVVAARGQAKLDETVEAMKAAGGSGQVFGSISVDITDSAAVDAAAAKALELLGGLDVLICNSGYAETGTVLEMPEDEYERLLDVNYMGHVRVVRAFAKHFTEQGHGHICLVSSMLALFSVWGFGAYSASKYAIAGFAEALRQEMRQHGVKVTHFYPPTTETPGLAKENETKHPVLYQLEHDNSFTKVYQPGQVATAILRAVEKGKFEAYVGWDSWLVYTTYRHLPRLARWLSDQELDTAVKKVASREGAHPL